MGTECSYDYVFVYDGDSFDAPLLGSFSGKTEPQNVTASSGFVSTQKHLLNITRHNVNDTENNRLFKV